MHLRPPRHPTHREEVSVIFAQVASGLGRDPVLNFDACQQPASAAVARVARTLNIVNGKSYPEGVRPGCATQRGWLGASAVPASLFFGQRSTRYPTYPTTAMVPGVPGSPCLLLLIMPRLRLG